MKLKISKALSALPTIDYRSLKELQGNLKDLSAKNYEKLKKSLVEFGFIVPIFIWKSGKDRMIIDAHQRIRVLKKEGAEPYQIPYVEIEAIDLKEAKKKLLVISSQYGTMTDQGFNDFIQDIEVDWAKEFANFDAINIEAPEEEDPKDENEIPSAPKKPITQRGDIWILGDHRLICADSRNTEAWAKLMEKEKASLVFTDPPYGVSYNAASDKFAKIRNDALEGNALTEFLQQVFDQTLRNASQDAAFYIWHASSTRNEFAQAMAASGLEERQYLIWAKNAFVLGHADYHWSHEPCFYACRAGGGARFYGDRAQQTVWRVTAGTKKSGLQTTIGPGLVLTDGKLSEIFIKETAPKNKKIRRIRIQGPINLRVEAAQGTLWEVDRDHGTEHPTQKPVELARRAIQNSSQTGDIVLDPFLGSGTTLIGAELTGRRCFGFELEPSYCDVIISRWQKITGKKAER